MNRRSLGRGIAAFGALAAFAWAGWAAHAFAIPELRVYDGYRMILWSTLAVAIVAPVIWRWRRDRALVAVALTAAVGCVAPLIISARQHHMPIPARLRGAWILAGADLVGPAMVVGFVCLWLALREWTATGTASRENRV